MRNLSQVLARNSIIVALVIIALAPRPTIAGTAYYPTQTNGYAIYLSPAKHSPEKYGCDGYAESAGANLVAQVVKDWLFNVGYMVQIGDGDPAHNISESNAWGSDVHIPIHSNAREPYNCADTDPQLGGTWLMYADNADYVIADKILNRMRSYSPGTNDRIGTDAQLSAIGSLGELRHTTMPAGYVEAAFHTFKPDKDWLVQSAAVAERIAWGIDDYFGNPRCGINIICMLTVSEGPIGTESTPLAPSVAATDYRVALNARPFPQLRAALEQVLMGSPNSASEASVFSPLTAGMVNDVRLAGDTAVVDFGDFSRIIPNAASSAAGSEMMAELNDVVFGFEVVNQVYYQFEGSCEAFYGWLQSDCQPITRSFWLNRKLGSFTNNNPLRTLAVARRPVW